MLSVLIMQSLPTLVFWHNDALWKTANAVKLQLGEASVLVLGAVALPVLKRTSSEKNQFWKEPVLKRTSLEKNQFWKEPVLKRTSSEKNQFWKEPVLEKNQFWKEPVLKRTSSEKNQLWYSYDCNITTSILVDLCWFHTVLL